MRFFDFNNRFPYTAVIYARNYFEALDIYCNEVFVERKEILPFPEPLDIDDVYRQFTKADIGAGDPEESWDDYLLRIIKSGKPQIVLLDPRLLPEVDE